MREIWIGLGCAVPSGAAVGATGSPFLGAVLIGAFGLIAGIGMFDERRQRERVEAERDMLLQTLDGGPPRRAATPL